MALAVNRETVDRLQTRLKNLKADAKEAARQTQNSVLTVAGGAAAGALEAKMPFIGQSEVPTAAALGVGLVGLSISGMLDDYSEQANAVGSGLLAVVTAKEVERTMRSRE